MKNDKKKKLLYSAYSAIFIGICLVPSVMMPFSKAKGASENRALAERPSLKTDDGKINLDFFSDFDEYFSEHFAYRQQLVTLDGKIRSEFFNSSSNKDVIVGSDGWLFYEPTSNDFMNINTMSDRGINNIVHNLSLLSSYCNQQHATFIFTVAPNKNSIYPEYMPYNYIKTENPGNLEKLEAVIQKKQHEHTQQVISSGELDSGYFHYCDLKKALLNAKSESKSPIYHKTDTHWNNIGALEARNALLSLSDVTDGFYDSQWENKKDWSGDLAEMIYPSDVPLDNQYYIRYNFTYQYAGRFRGLDDINIQTTCADHCVGRSGKLLMYRDSFGEAILPFMAQSFGSAEFSRAVPYNTSSITQGVTVILEIVERNLENLQKYAPVMPAPVYDGTLDCDAECSDFSVKAEKSGEFIHIYGELGNDFFTDDNARIFVTINGTSYEAFNCFEDKLLDKEGTSSDNGFSLYITDNDGEVPDLSEIKISVLSENGQCVKTI